MARRVHCCFATDNGDLSLCCKISTWQGYRLCCNFSAEGIANWVATLLHDDWTFNDGRALCGWVSVGCGSGKEIAESQAKEMFAVLCEAMAKVLCTNKDKSEADQISKEITRKLRDFIGVVSLRDVIKIGERGEFLEHETYCFGSRFLGAETPADVLDIVNRTFKKKRKAESEYAPSRSPSPPPKPMVKPADTKASSEVISIDSDDDVDETGRQKVSEHTADERSSSAEKLPKESNSTQGNDDDESDFLTEPSRRKGKADRQQSMPWASKEARALETHDLSPVGSEVRESLPAPSSSSLLNAVRAKKSDTEISSTKNKLVELNQELKGSSRGASASRGGWAGPLSDVVKGKTARSGDTGDIRMYCSKESHRSRPGGKDVLVDETRHPVLTLEIVPGYGAEVKGWQNQEPFFLSRRGQAEYMPTSCIIDGSEGFPSSLANVQWDKEDSYKIWKKQAEEYGKEYERTLTSFDEWVSYLPSDMICGAGVEGRAGPEDKLGSSERATLPIANSARFRQDESAEDEDLSNFLAAPSADSSNYHVVIDRSVLAAIVDISYGDTEHESIGLLFGKVIDRRKEIRVIDCESIKRDVDNLHPDRVSFDISWLVGLRSKYHAPGVDFVGWFHSHLCHRPLPSKADVELHSEIAQNIGDHAVGLICCLDQGGESNGDCSRITLTAFRDQEGSKGARVQWRVHETPGMSHEAVQRCFECVQNAEKENKELCEGLRTDPACSNAVQQWLWVKWQEYLIRLLHGTIPLILNQLEQSSQNLRVQWFQIQHRHAMQKLKGGIGEFALARVSSDRPGTPDDGEGMCVQRINYHTDEASEKRQSTSPGSQVPAPSSPTGSKANGAFVDRSLGTSASASTDKQGTSAARGGRMSLNGAKERAADKLSTAGSDDSDQVGAHKSSDSADRARDSKPGAFVHKDIGGKAAGHAGRARGREQVGGSGDRLPQVADGAYLRKSERATSGKPKKYTAPGSRSGSDESGADSQDDDDEDFQVPPGTDKKRKGREQLGKDGHPSSQKRRLAAEKGTGNPFAFDLTGDSQSSQQQDGVSMKTSKRGRGGCRE